MIAEVIYINIYQLTSLMINIMKILIFIELFLKLYCIHPTRKQDNHIENTRVRYRHILF